MKAIEHLDFSQPKAIGIFGNSKEEKFKALLKIYEKVSKKNNSIIISFYFNEELNSYFETRNILKLKDITSLSDRKTIFNKSIPLDEQEKTLNKLLNLMLTKSNKEPLFIFLDETILSHKILNIIKISKIKNISIIYSSAKISKEFILLTEEKFYGKTTSPQGIDLIQNKTGLDRNLIKNMKDCEFIYKLYGGDSIITSF